MNGQVSLFKPPWIECFKTCKYFDSHPEWPPDTFPLPSDMKRCMYCDHQYGTSGKQFRMIYEGRSIEMYCVHYEEKE